MSGSANKKIRKYLRKEMAPMVNVEAKWRFPWCYFPRTRKGWFAINKFPVGSWRFKFRYVKEVVIKGSGRVVLQKG